MINEQTEDAAILLAEELQTHQEAKRVLASTNIETDLQQFGQVNLIGSYKYHVMVMRDLDFHVIVPSLDVNLANRFFQYAVAKELYEYVQFRDKHLFNEQAAAKYATKKALDSYSFGLRLMHNSHEWQIGVNFILQPQEASNEIIRLFEKGASDQQRGQILKFKHELLERGDKVSSAFIYRAVLEKDISDLGELYAYLESLGYRFDV